MLSLVGAVLLNFGDEAMIVRPSSANGFKHSVYCCVPPMFVVDVNRPSEVQISLRIPLTHSASLVCPCSLASAPTREPPQRDHWASTVGVGGALSAKTNALMAAMVGQ